MKFPEDYALGAEMVSTIVGFFANAKDVPHFRFPPREIAVAVGLDAIGGRLCLNGPAVLCMTAMLAASNKMGWPAPTLLMLQAACSVHKVESETCSLSELGIQVPTS